MKLFDKDRSSLHALYELTLTINYCHVAFTAVHSDDSVAWIIPIVKGSIRLKEVKVNRKHKPPPYLNNIIVQFSQVSLRVNRYLKCHLQWSLLLFHLNIHLLFLHFCWAQTSFCSELSILFSCCSLFIISYS